MNEATLCDRNMRAQDMTYVLSEQFYRVYFNHEIWHATNTTYERQQMLVPASRELSIPQYWA